MYYRCSENKGAEQLRGYREADLRLCFRICRLLVSHEAAQIYFDHLNQNYFEESQTFLRFCPISVIQKVLEKCQPEIMG